MTILGCEITTESTGVMLADAAVVHHNTWIARAVDQCVRSRRQFVMVTPPETRLTLGLARVMELTNSRWVVSGSDGLPYNGLTGAMNQWDGEKYREDPEISVTFQEGLRPTAGGVLVAAEAMYSARRSTLIGALTATSINALTGCEPQGWGVQEPAAQRWSLPQITEHYRKDASPMSVMHAAATVRTDSQNVQHCAAVTQIERPRRGVVERVSAGFRTQRPWGADQRMAFAQQMHECGVRWAVSQHVLGYDPAYRIGYYAGVPVPSVAVFGPEALAQQGAGQALDFARRMVGSAEHDHVQLLGASGRESLVVQFGNAPSSVRRHPVVEYNELTQYLASSQTRRRSPG